MNDTERLVERIARSEMTRQQFLVRAAALGLGTSALGGFLAACGSESGSSASPSASTAGKPVRIALFVPSIANSYHAMHVKGATDACNAAGNATLKVYSADWKSDTQLTQVQDAVASGQFDGFTVVATDGNALVGVVQDAIAAGVKVAAVYTPIGPDHESADAQVEGILCTIGNKIRPSGYELGAQLVKAAQEAGDEEFEVGYDGNDFRAPDENWKWEGFQEAIKSAPNVKVVAKGEGGYLIEGGLKVAQDALQAHPNMKGWVSTGDQSTFGAAQAFKEAGNKATVFIGMGATTSACAEVKAGRWWGSYVYLPQSEARMGTERAIKAARGEEVPYEGIRMEDVSSIGPFLDKTNVEGFEPEWDIS